MKKAIIATVCMLSVCLTAATGFSDMKKGEKIDAAKEFANHCAVCHPNGGNIINSKQPLNKSALAAAGIKDWKGIVQKMRNPGPGMTKFDEKTIPDKEAKAIAEYILKTFK